MQDDDKIRSRKHLQLGAVGSDRHSFTAALKTILDSHRTLTIWGGVAPRTLAIRGDEHSNSDTGEDLHLLTNDKAQWL